jgi:hypothetical protein
MLNCACKKKKNNSFSSAQDQTIDVHGRPQNVVKYKLYCHCNNIAGAARSGAKGAPGS